MKWGDASAACRLENASLVTVNSEAENAALIVFGYGMAPFWIGIKKVSVNNFLQ